MGRPTKLTPDMQEKICQVIRAGNYAEVAAAYAGISHSRFYDWLKRGENGEQPYRDFRDSVEKAKADSEVRDILAIDQCIKGGTVVAKTTTVTETTRPSGVTTTKTVTTESYQPPQWTAAAWRLERKLPARWSQSKQRDAESAKGNDPPLLAAFMAVIHSADDQEPAPIPTEEELYADSLPTISESPAINP